MSLLRTSSGFFGFLAILCFSFFPADAFSAADSSQEIPDEARRHLVRGKAAIQSAKSISDYEEAVAEFTAALKIAPGWSESYYNLALAQEGANQLSQAILSFKSYLLARPDAPDAKEIQDKIYALEYREEKTIKAAKRKEAIERSLAAGNWSVKEIMADGQIPYQVQNKKIGTG